MRVRFSRSSRQCSSRDTMMSARGRVSSADRSHCISSSSARGAKVRHRDPSVTGPPKCTRMKNRSLNGSMYVSLSMTWQPCSDSQRVTV